MRIRFHPIHYTALVSVMLVIGSLWLSYELQQALIFVFGCVMLPIVSQIGRFEEAPGEDDDPGYNEHRAGFTADIEGPR